MKIPYVPVNGSPGKPYRFGPQIDSLGSPLFVSYYKPAGALALSPHHPEWPSMEYIGKYQEGVASCFRHWTNINEMWVQFEATLELSPIFTANVWSDLKLLYLVALTLRWSKKFCGLDSIWPRNVHGHNPNFKCVVWSLLDVYQQVSFTQMKHIRFLLEHNVH